MIRSNRSAAAIRCAAVLTFGASCVSCTVSNAEPTVSRTPLPTLSGAGPAPVFAADPARGKRLYAAHCARCHGQDGAGDGPLAVGLSPRPPNWTLAAALVDRRPDALFMAIRRGVLGTSMKRFDTVLDEPSTWDVVFFIWQRPMAIGAGADGDAVYQARCAACHGPGGQPADTARAPSLVRPEWVAKTRQQLTRDVVTAHPWLALSPNGASDASLVAERLWTFLTVATATPSPTAIRPAGAPHAATAAP